MKKWDTITDHLIFDLDGRDERLWNIIDEGSAHNTFHSLITYYMATVAEKVDVAQNIHNEIVRALRLPYLFRVRAMATLELYFIAKKRVIRRKYGCYATICELWGIMLFLNGRVEHNLSDRFRQEANEINNAVQTYFSGRQ